MSHSNDNILAKVIDLTENYHFSVKRNIYRETLRQLLNVFGNVYYLDGSNNRIKVNCSTAKPDRPTGKDANENNLVLPYITISEIGSEEADGRRRVHNLLVNEKIWDPKENRAKRYLSLAPKAININYEINIWAKYNADLDQIRYSIFSLFHPSLEIRTSFSDFTKAFVKSESDISSPQAGDTTDRLIQKTISISVETYLPSPKFLYTNTGEIKSFNAEVTLVDTRASVTEEVDGINVRVVEVDRTGGEAGPNRTLTLSGSLVDVDINSVTFGDVLVWNGDYWTASGLADLIGGENLNHQVLTNRGALDAHPQYASSSVSAYAFGLSSILASHIANSDIHFTSGSLSGAYVLTSTNSNLSSLVSDIQTSTISLSSYIAANESSWSSAGATYLSSLLDVDPNSFPAANKYSVIYNSSTDLFEVRQLQFNDLSDYVFTGVLSDNWVLAYTSIVPAGFTARPLSDLVQLDTLNDVDVPSPALNDILQYTDDGLSYQWRNIPASSLVSGIEASTITISSTLESHLASAVHWELSTLNENYLNASGDSANAGFYLSSVSATDISATNYYNLPSATIVWEAARDIVLLVRNGYASRTINKGEPVTIVSGTGNSGGIPVVEILSSVNTHVPDADLLSNHVAGLARENILAGAEGYIIVEGLLTKVDTDAFSVGDWLYVSSNGQLSNQRPTPPYESHPVGVVTRSQQVNGTILVKIENSPELNDIVGFNLNSNILNGDIITYDLTTSTFVNKQTVNVSGLGKFGTVSATTVSAETLHVGGSDGIIKNNNGDIIISATNGIIRFPYGLSAASVSTTTYTGLPSSTPTWNANQLQGRNVLNQIPSTGQVLTWNIDRWEPSTVSTGGGPGGVTDHGALTGLEDNDHPQYASSSVSAQIQSVSAYASGVSSIVSSHINDSTIHFTSGSLSGYYAASSWTENRYVLSSTNTNLSSLVSNIQTSSNNLSGVVGAHIASSDVHFTSGSLSGAYVLINTNQSLSSLVDNLQASTASISSVVNSHIASADVHFTSGSLSGYYAASSWVNSNYSPTSHNHTFSALSGLSDTLITSPSQGQSLVWSSTKWVPSSVGGGGTGSTNPGGPDTSVQFNNSNSFSGVSEFTFNRSANRLSVPTLSATTYQNLPSGSPVWNASSLLGYDISYAGGNPNEVDVLLYTDYGFGPAVPKAWRSVPPSVYGNVGSYFNANRIQSVSASPTVPTSNQILVYSGAATAWVPKNISEGSTASAFVFNNNGILSGTNDVFWSPSNRTLTTLKINNYEDIYSNYFNGQFGTLGPTGLQANQVSATTYLNLPISYGTAAPNNGTGNEGDIYLQYS